MKTNIRHLSSQELTAFFVSSGDKAFRARQVEEWLWKKAARSFAEMTNLSKETRNLLEENFKIDAIAVDKKQVSNDRTIKSAFRLHVLDALR